jgi:GNAT superfamily N-acetyltransferase
VTDLSTRTATPADAETLFDLQKAASLAAFAGIFTGPFPDEEIRADWAAKLTDPDREVLIAEEGDKAIGFATRAPEMLEQLFVLPEAQGTGVGSALHDAVLDRQRAAGETICRLWVLEANEQARAFYERRGWRADGDTRLTNEPPRPRALRYAIRL